MTRTMLIASVAGLAIVTPAAGASAASFDQKPDHAERQDRGKEARQDNRQQQRVERRQDARQQERQVERADARQQQRADARQQQRAQQRQVQQQERAQERQAQRAQERQQQRAQERQAQRAQERQQERSQQRQAQRAQERQHQRAQERQAQRAQERQQQVAQERQQRRQVERTQQRQQQRVVERQAERAQDRRVERRQQQRMEDRRAQIAQERRLQQRADERRADRSFDRHLKAEAKQGRRVEKALADQRKDIREYRAEARRDIARVERRAEKRYAQRAAYRDWLEQGERRAVVQRIADQPVRFVRTGTQVSRDWYQPRLPTAYRSRYVDDRNSYYRYDPSLDNIYRIDRTRNVVRSVIPAYYSPDWIGRSVPSYYDQGYVPYGYGSAYYPTSNSYYRTVGPAVYRVDPTTQLITAVVALLTGQNFSVGQMMPTGYDVYNVPTSYRSQYYDTSDAWYRYDDGTVYEIDPRTRYVTDAYPLYEADYMVGSPWPTEYPDYNVPYGYQGLYYDTPDANYRYADNAIYRVDPATQLITALVSLVTGQPLSVGQPMPASYGVYNVPQQYRSRFVERPDVNYRYVDGYVYAVDPDSYLITDSYDLYT